MTTALLNNRYQILESLARGGFGETFLAIDTHLPSARKCVIKQLKPIIQSPSLPQWLKERFQREATILEDLGDKNAQIPQLYAYFAEEDNFYLVQEWIEGLTLTQKHQLEGNFTSEEVTDILVQILPVLDYIHHRRIIHRDVKPDNIIIRSSDRLPVLIDFGIMKEAMATLVQPDGVSAYSIALGTPGYMASEQAAGRPVFSSDLYSLGLTAVFLLSGKTPQYLETDPRSGEILWRNSVPNLHSNLAAVIDRAIRFHPRDRFSSAQEMLAALQHPPETKTVATVAVSPGSLKPGKILAQQPIATQPDPEMILPAVEWEPEEKKSAWSGITFFLSVGGLMIGGFILGLSIFLAQQRSDHTPKPTPIEATPEPQISVTPSPVAPEIVPRRRPSRQPIPSNTFTPVPPPETSPSPLETIVPSPEGEITPTPLESPTSSPSGETTPTPSENPAASPAGQTPPTTPENPAASPSGETAPTSPSPTPSPTVQPSPAASSAPSQPTPQPSPSATPEQEKSTSGDHQSRVLKIPVVATGTKEELIRRKLGQPTTINKGLWGNTQAVLYKNVVPSKVDIGYLFEPESGRVRQSEVSVAQSVGLATIKTTLNQLLRGNAPPSVKQALEQIYLRQSNQHSFLVGNLKGTIQRNQFDRIYIGIWEADFH
ncbi:serine/threonine-protein kinase [Gloeothece verrucosa]|uniref:non-specific serine/threonine protein kinase n=1 Tax=Gloeothece verrucosa (strain PCC 7822) TaxID=497965 RepID=E0UJJ4_GLOV7|nr:serine/threonine-protein kinase [Gloeothece verrucosa]ADN12238.1 serine/threonine protein kinase [Gloeothece verrucosa PCC 7822]